MPCFSRRPYGGTLFSVLESRYIGTTAFKREAEACFEASRMLIDGVQIPSTDGTRVPVTFRTTYSALEVDEHLRILRMAADELGIRFPVDEVEEAERPIQDQTER